MANKQRSTKPDDNALEKAFMVRHIWECETKLGMSETALRQEREWLAKRFGYSAESARAITAHLRIRFDGIVPGEISVSNAEFARQWVALASTVAEREQYKEEIAGLMKVDVATIMAITDGVRGDIDEIMQDDEPEQATESASEPKMADWQLRFAKAYVRLAQSQSKPISPVYQELGKHFKMQPAIVRQLVEESEKPVAAKPEKAPTIVRPESNAYDPVKMLKGGEHVDYSTKSKEAWRQTWKRYLDEHTDPEMRKDMRVLCLPGKRCLEIPLYVELGFRPENIVAVEGGDRIARAQFEFTVKQRAREWGGILDYRLAKLEDIIKQEKKPFDVVSLDFVGQMCPRNLYIASNVPTADKAVFLMTDWTRRWHEQMTLERDEALARVIEFEQKETQLKSVHADMHGQESGLIGISHVNRDVSMGAMNLGVDRSDHWQFRQRVRRMPMLGGTDTKTSHEREREEQNVATVLEPMLEKLIMTLHRHGLFDASSFKEMKRMCDIGTMFTGALFDKAIIEHAERWLYRSTVSTSLHEFRTDLAVVSRPRAARERWKGVIDFLSHCVEHGAELMRTAGSAPAPLDALHFELRRDKMDVALEPGTATTDDLLVCVCDGKIIGRRTVSELLDAAREHGEILAAAPHADASVRAKLQRKEIHY